jgi:hypothetical protein
MFFVPGVGLVKHVTYAIDYAGRSRIYSRQITYTAKRDQVVAILMKTGLTNVLLPTMPHCSQLSTILNNIVTPDSGSTTVFNIVDKCEQRGQQNIVQSC